MSTGNDNNSNNDEFDQFIENLSSQDEQVKKKALDILEKRARRNHYIEKVIEKLKDLILEDIPDIWIKTGNVLNYYFQNYISYIWYSFQAETFFNKLIELQNENRDIRKRAFSYLSRQRVRKPGRNWTFFTFKEVESYKRKLSSKDLAIRQKTTNELLKKVKENCNISELINPLRDLLIDEDKQVKWDAAFTLTNFYGKFTTVTYGYYMEHVELLKSSNKNDIINSLQFLESLTMPDLVSDRDERDIGFAIPAISALLNESDIEIRKMALQTIHTALKEGQDVSDSLPSIIKILSENDIELHEKAGFILRDMAMDETNLSVHITQLQVLLNSKSDPVKFGVADALTAYYGYNNNSVGINKLLSHEDKDVRQETAGTLEQMWRKSNDFTVNPFLNKLKALLKDNEKEVRLVAARSLVSICKISEKTIVSLTIPILKEALVDPERKIRLTAAHNLKSINEYEIDISSAIPNLLKALDDEHEDIAKLIFETIMKFIKRVKNAELVMEKINEYNLITPKDHLKKLIAKCNRYLQKEKKAKKGKKRKKK